MIIYKLWVITIFTCLVVCEIEKDTSCTKNNGGKAFQQGNCYPIQRDQKHYPDKIKSISYHCKVSHGKNPYLKVTWNETAADNVWFYRIILKEEKKGKKRSCHRVSNKTQIFNFTCSKGFNPEKEYFITIIANPVKTLLTSSSQFKLNRCQNDIAKKTFTTITPITTETSTTITPIATDTFTTITPITTDTSTTITPITTDTSTTITPINTTHSRIPDTTKERIRNKSLTILDKKDFQIILLLICTIALLSMTAVIFVLWSRRKTKSRNIFNNKGVSDIYVSHCSFKTKEKDRLLHFFEELNSFNVRVNTDLFNKTSMELNGGPCEWIPRYVKAAKKIIIVVTPSYIKVVQEKKTNIEDQNEVNKVRTEYRHITHRLYKSNLAKKESIILLVDNRVKSKDIPVALEGCTQFNYDKCLKAESDDIVVLSCLLSNVEPISYESV